jgi:hypothetical protein
MVASTIIIVQVGQRLAKRNSDILEIGWADLRECVIILVKLH